MPDYGGRSPDLTAAYPFRIPAHSPNGQGPVEPRIRDDVTRYLCAAAHLDDDYADGAIREFLTERTRQIPPSPGVDAAAVLTEAVAARARRKLRDWALILLMAVFVLVAPIIFTAAWILVAHREGGRQSEPGHRPGSRSPPGWPGDRRADRRFRR